MVVLGGLKFLISEVPLYGQEGRASAIRGQVRSESARQGLWFRVRSLGFRCGGGARKGSFLRLIDVCITQL